MDAITAGVILTGIGTIITAIFAGLLSLRQKTTAEAIERDAAIQRAVNAALLKEAEAAAATAKALDEKADLNLAKVDEIHVLTNSQATKQNDKIDKLEAIILDLQSDAKKASELALQAEQNRTAAALAGQPGPAMQSPSVLQAPPPIQQVEVVNEGDSAVPVDVVVKLEPPA